MTPNHLAALDAAAALGKKAGSRPGNGMIDRIEQCDRWDAFACAAANLDHAAIATELRAKDAALNQVGELVGEMTCMCGKSKCFRCRSIDIIEAALTPAAGDDHE